MISAVRSEKLEVRNGGGGASNLEAPQLYMYLKRPEWKEIFLPGFFLYNLLVTGA